MWVRVFKYIFAFIGLRIGFFFRLCFFCWVYIFFFFNIVLMWKIVGASKVSVLYIYIYIYIDDLLVGFLFVFMTKFDIKGETES